jgi:hypothetical protein
MSDRFEASILAPWATGVPELGRKLPHAFLAALVAKSLVNIQRRFALELAEILGKHIAEQRTLFDGVV